MWWHNESGDLGSKLIILLQLEKLWVYTNGTQNNSGAEIFLLSAHSLPVSFFPVSACNCVPRSRIIERWTGKC